VARRARIPHREGGAVQLRIGTYFFDQNATEVTSSAELKFNEGGQPYSQLVSLDVAGFLSGTSQADLTQKASALTNVLSTPFQDVVLLQDSGSPSQTGLLNATSLTGVRFYGPHFDRAQGAEYATLRHFSFRATAEYAAPGSASLLLSWTETLELSGGGPLRTVLTAVAGPMQEQQVYPATPYEARQTGAIVGYQAYPPAPAPIFPAKLRQSGNFSRTSPRRKGRPGAYEGYAVRYSYEFVSATPLIGLPRLWVS
jgi:hypothetical protein